MKTVCKILSLGMVCCLLIGLFTGCGGSARPQTKSSGKLQIVTTIFPEYDWVRQIAGEKLADIELTLLLDNGIDLHSYQPTMEDMMKLSKCSLFVYVGGESDAWVESALKSVDNPDLVAVNLLETLGDVVKEEELVDGMQAEAEEEEAEEEEVEYDEHVWLSVRNAALLCGVLAEKMGAVDPDNAALYSQNAESYIAQLRSLDEQYQETVTNGRVKTVLFADRFPFRYMTEDYGLTYYAAFVGCSSESAATFQTILFLSGKLDELGLRHVLQIESADGSLARTVIENTKDKDQQVLTMNSLQSATSADVENGVTYLSVMEQNLEVLRQALQ